MISQTALHAIRALTHLAGSDPERFLGASELASRVGAPPNYLGKLLQKLGHAGLVETRKGAGGGVRLARSPEQIRLIEIVGSLEEVGSFSGCFLDGGACSETDPCGVHERWKALIEQYNLLLTTTTLLNLIDDRDRNALPGEGRS